MLRHGTQNTVIRTVHKEFYSFYNNSLSIIHLHSLLHRKQIW